MIATAVAVKLEKALLRVDVRVVRFTRYIDSSKVHRAREGHRIGAYGCARALDG